jgi:hypothetical protein
LKTIGKRFFLFSLVILAATVTLYLRPGEGRKRSDAAPPASVVLTVNTNTVKGVFSNRMLGVSFVNWEHAWGKPYAAEVPGLVQALKAAHVGIIRYAGGNWTNTTGWDRAEARRPYEGWPNSDEGPYWFHYNTAEIDSVASLAKQIGADVIVEVNVSTSDPGMWADMVRYANVEHDYNFKYWEIGNELDLANSTPSPDEYVKRLSQYIDAMMDVDSSIKIIASAAASPYEAPRLGFKDSITSLSSYLTKPYALVTPKGRKIQALSYHWYQACKTGNVADLQRYAYDGLDNNSWRNGYSRSFADLLPPRITAEISGGTIPQGITELDFDACWHDNPMNGNFLNALWTSDVLGRLAYNGVDYVTRWEGYGTQAYAFLYPDNGGGPARIYARPAFYAYLMYAYYFGNQLVESSTNDNDRISIWASRDTADASKLKLMVTNISGSAITAPVSITGFNAASAKLYQLRSANPASVADASLTAAATINGVSVNAMDVAAAISAIRPVSLPVSGSSFTYTFPAYSTTALVIGSADDASPAQAPAANGAPARQK